jgi:pyrimidine operon attenuation protein/uracil phosphoribosyltransferase
MSRDVERRKRPTREHGALQPASPRADAPLAADATTPSALTIMDSAEIARAIRRLAHEIEERNRGKTLALVGVLRRGAALSQRLRLLLAEMGCGEVPVGTLDISLYRDDGRGTSADPQLLDRSIPFSLNGRTIVLADDVLYTGRTVRAALQALSELGRPRAIQLAVLVDRGERELPIRADYVGKNVAAGAGQRVYVRLAEIDGIDAVIVGRANQIMLAHPSRSA